MSNENKLTNELHKSAQKALRDAAEMLTTAFQNGKMSEESPAGQKVSELIKRAETLAKHELEGFPCDEAVVVLLNGVFPLVCFDDESLVKIGEFWSVASGLFHLGRPAGSLSMYGALTQVFSSPGIRIDSPSMRVFGAPGGPWKQEGFGSGTPFPNVPLGEITENPGVVYERDWNGSLQGVDLGWGDLIPSQFQIPKEYRRPRDESKKSDENEGESEG